VGTLHPLGYSRGTRAGALCVLGCFRRGCRGDPCGRPVHLVHPVHIVHTAPMFSRGARAHPLVPLGILYAPPHQVAHGVPPCLPKHGEDAMRYLSEGLEWGRGLPSENIRGDRAHPPLCLCVPKRTRTINYSLLTINSPSPSSPTFYFLLFTFPRGQGAPARVPLEAWWGVRWLSELGLDFSGKSAYR